MSKIRIGIDAMGGDYAPEAVVKGALLAYESLKDDAQIVLLGDQEQIEILLATHLPAGQDSPFEIKHCSEVVEMCENPTRAFSSKPDSSLSQGFKMLKDKTLDSFSSAGNSGAMLVGGFYTVKAIPGIIRPCISSTIPLYDGREALLLDVGVNADCKPDVLLQFGILGSLFAKHINGIKRPKVALLNIGEEEGKGNMLAQSTYQLLKEESRFEFIGNIEGRDILFTEADIIVTDGFTGNIVLKQLEGMYTLMRKLKLDHPFLDKFNYENYGGTPILGMNANVLIGHGISNDRAISNMLKLSSKLVKAKLVEKITDAFQI
ncbi:MAG: phosphate acyltransferase PlsX [Flavobacteriales bacterium]